MDETFVATDEWLAEFPGATAGVLVLHEVSNPARNEALEARKRDLEQELRNGNGFGETLRAYEDYFRARGQRYHVRAQRESVAAKGKPIPSRAALVEAMFMAELRNLVLSAGHDLATLELPLRVDATRAGERYTLYNGTETTLRAGDMKMADHKGIVTSVLRGPDRRTLITPNTTRVLFAAYAPPGVDATVVERHLEDIRANVLLIAPAAETFLLTTVTSPSTS